MDFQTKVNQKEDKSFTLGITIPAKTVEEEYKKVLEKQAEEADMKGFRKGKAPVKLIEEKIGKDKLKNLLLENLIKKAYPEAVKEEDLKPIIPPQVKLTSTEEGEDWEIEFVSSEMPEIKLEKVKDEIKEVNAKSKIWTPGEEPSGEDKKENKDKQIQKIIDTIIKSAEVDLPDILIEEEVNRKLVNLIDQVNSAGMELEKYLATKGTSMEELKKQYRQEIINNWKVDLALEKLADEEDIQVTEKDTERIEKSKMNPYIAAKIIRRQKTLEHLLTL